MYEPGTVIAGKYRVDSVLGRGGMGIVVAAEHVDLRTRVALKFLAPEWVEHAVTVERFVREARASAQLRSEHVCRVFDVGRLDSGVPFLVMELLDGADLANVLREHGRLDPAVAADYLLQACDALGEAHALGIVHRDVKPANLYVLQRPGQMPLVKVLDFGIAKAQLDGETALTRTDSIMGSPAYMAPEQLRASRFADARSDIWSLGVVLAELVTGCKPFTGESTIELALQIVEQAPRLPAMPSDVAMVIATCLHKDPARRFQVVAQLVAALEPIARRGTAVPSELSLGETVLAPVPVPVLVPAPVPAVGQTTLGSASGVSGPLPRQAKSRRLVWIVLGAIAVGAGIGAASLVPGGSESPKHAVAPPAPPVPPDAALQQSAPPPAPIDAAPPPPIDAAPPPIDAAPVPDAHPIHHPTPPHPPPQPPHTKEQIGESRN